VSRRERPAREPQRLLNEPQRLLNEPPRLLHDRELGKLMSSANAVYRAGLDEAGAFQRLSQRLEAPVRRSRWQGPAFAAALSLAAGVVMALGVFDEAPSRVAVGPEVSPPRRALPDDESPAAELDSTGASPASAAPATPAGRSAAARTISTDGVSSVQPSAREQQAVRGEAASRAEAGSSKEASAQRAAAVDVSAPDRTVPAERAANGGEPLGSRRSVDGSRHELQLDGLANASAKLRQQDAERQDAPSDKKRGNTALPGHAIHPEASAKPAASTGRETGVGTPAAPALGVAAAPSSAAPTAEARVDCSDLVEKDARAAEHCYALRAAESSGLSAEAALYELARLRRDVQRDAKGALVALNQYRERFPRGSLRNEVGLSRVELLSQLGRSREALNEAEALLGSAKERAAELYVLRGDIFRRDLADFAGAAQEYAKAEQFGGAFGAEATRLRGLSLEALGDVQGALAAYRRYLSGPDQPRKVEVNRRVEALTSSLPGTSP
jgi:tetratricopeptide (TPR) repeat protein